MQHACAQTPVCSLRMSMGVEHPSLICFLTFFHPGKPIPAGRSDAVLGAGDPPKRAAGGMRFGSVGVCTAPPSFCPPKWDGDGKESTYGLINGLFNNASSASPLPRQAARKAYRITQPLLPTLVGALN